jgi:hypothetical protein
MLGHGHEDLQLAQGKAKRALLHGVIDNYGKS